MPMGNGRIDRAAPLTNQPPSFYTVRPVKRGSKTVYEVVYWYFAEGRNRRKVVALLRSIPTVEAALAHERDTLARLKADQDSINRDDPGQLGMRRHLILGRRIAKVMGRSQLLESISRGAFGPPSDGPPRWTTAPAPETPGRPELQR